MTGCASADTPADAWVFRPPPGQPSLLEAVRDSPFGPAEGYALGNLIGTVLIGVAAR